MYSQFRAMNQMQHAVHVFLQFKTCLLSLLMVQHRSYPAYVNWIKIISWVFGYLCEYHIFNPVMFHPKIGSCRAGSRSSVLVFWVISKPDTIGREVQKLFSLFTTRKVLHNSNNKQLEFCGNQCTAPPLFVSWEESSQTESRRMWKFCGEHQTCSVLEISLPEHICAMQWSTLHCRVAYTLWGLVLCLRAYVWN